MSRDLQIFFRSLIILHILLFDYVQSAPGELRKDSPRACAFVQCGPSEHCVQRKFWCKNSPCPSMIYCSKTPRESLRGPTSCASVRCGGGYICLVQVRKCRWDQKCKQQIARCVSEREYYDGPSSCADVHCQFGRQCILKESQCANPPCKLFKSCAKTEDVQVWHSECRTLGCPSEYECFLRRPSPACNRFVDPCKHAPDCTITNDEKISMSPECRGWVCPPHQKCSAVVSEDCSYQNNFGSCEVNRTCDHKPLANSDTALSHSSLRLFPRMPTTASEIQYVTWPAKNSTYHSDHPTEQTTTSVVVTENASNTKQTECNLDQSTTRGNWSTQLVKWNPQDGSVYRVPVYIRSNIKTNSSEVRKFLSEEKPSNISITAWLDHLRLKTGVNAINVWVKHAEENRKYTQFAEWLAAVKTALGPFRFRIWLEEIRRRTSEHPAFKKWLDVNEGLSSMTDRHTESENNSQLKTLTDFIDQEEKSDVIDEDVNITGNPVRTDYETLETDFYRPGRTENRHLFFSVDDGTRNIPIRQKVDHPRRINSDQNDSYKHYRDFGLTDTKNDTRTSYWTKDPLSQLRTKAERGADRDYSIIHQTQNEYTTQQNFPGLEYSTVGSSSKRNGNVQDTSTNDFAMDSVMQLRKRNMWKDSKMQHDVQGHSLQSPLRNVGSEQGRHEMHDVINQNGNAQDPHGFVGVGFDPSVILDEVKGPTWNSNLQKNVDPIFTDTAEQFSENGTKEFPESMQPQYFEVFWDLDPMVPGVSSRSQNPSPDLNSEQSKNLTNPYTMFAPAAEELHVISPWNTVQVLDPAERTFFTLVEFPGQEQGNDQMRIIRYPLIVSKLPSIEQANVSTQNPKDAVGSLQHAQSNAEKGITNTPNPWHKIVQYEQIPPRSNPSIKNSDDLVLREGKLQIDTKIHEQTPDHEVSTPLETWYLWNGVKPGHPPEATHTLKLHTNPVSKELPDLEESLKEYVDAYVEAVIEDALSQVILSEKLQEAEGPINWKEPEDPESLHHTTIAAIRHDKFKEQHSPDNLHGAQLSEREHAETGLTDKQENQELTTSDSPENVSTIMKEVLTTNGNGTTTPSSSSIDSIITEFVYQYDCEDEENASPQTMETKESSVIGDVAYIPTSSGSDGSDQRYYTEDRERTTYPEESSGYHEEYSAEFGTNITDHYDSQYYAEEEYDEGISYLPEIQT